MLILVYPQQGYTACPTARSVFHPLRDTQGTLRPDFAESRVLFHFNMAIKYDLALTLG